MIGEVSTRRLAEFQPEGWRSFNPKVGALQAVLKKIAANGKNLQRTRSSPHDGRYGASTASAALKHRAKAHNFFAGCFQYLSFYL